MPQPHTIPRGLHLTHGGYGSARLVPPLANKRGGAGPGECSGEGGPPALASLAWLLEIN